MPNGLPTETPKSSKMLKNPEKPSTKCPPGGYVTPTLKKTRKSHQIYAYQGGPICNPYTPVQSKHMFSISYFSSKIHRTYLQNAPFWTPFGLLWAPKCVHMPLFRCFWGSLKNHVFLQGFRCSLLLHNGSKLAPPGSNFLTPFWSVMHTQRYGVSHK